MDSLYLQQWCHIFKRLASPFIACLMTQNNSIFSTLVNNRMEIILLHLFVVRPSFCIFLVLVSLRLWILKTPVNPALASTFWFYILHLVLSRGLCLCLSLLLASLGLLLQLSHGLEPEFQCNFSDSFLIPYHIDCPGQRGQTSFWSRIWGL